MSARTVGRRSSFSAHKRRDWHRQDCLGQVAYQHTADGRQKLVYTEVVAANYVLCRDFLRSKSVASAWCNCVEFQKPQHILQILLSQLKVPRRAQSNFWKPFTIHTRMPEPVLVTRIARGRLGMLIMSIRSSAARQTSCGSSQVHCLPVEPHNTATAARGLTP